ncbi:MAG: response regulator transcription factor [Acidobacteria bacterium]|nr:response regulator transcription factor [Acidobacteriota bacterium]
MKQVRLLIVDDEPLIRSGIRDGLSGREDIEVAGECGSVAEAIDSLRNDHVDLVLLDVELPDGTGFDLIRRFGPQRMPVVVFVTAYDKYAIQAFEVNAVDYLLKPFDQSRLLTSIDRAQARLEGSAQALAQRLEALIQTRDTQWQQTLVVRNGDRFDFVSVATVDWIEAANNYAVLHCPAGDHLVSESLTHLEERLDPNRFLRVHRSTIVNSSRIAAVHSMIGGVYELELRGGARIKTGRQYRDRIRRLLGAC